jgi:hypothetical protein
MKIVRKQVGKPSTISIFEFHKYGNETNIVFNGTKMRYWGNRKRTNTNGN